ncbi:conserved hypothetical protein [Flavobacterium sp. 9AF]|uniref:helix-turn-helix domain-containing protein n=1 Tax=Flavobacterium sp. 9AF TaxID=2653142 RepID=UPI0012F3DF88|nr:helix-turn-helix domain-containing protein [Flavobacterium sp. 9AF]VXC02207.1 conserved hypothetical protein [Flavobacterium sp. 9AF]
MKIIFPFLFLFISNVYCQNKISLSNQIYKELKEKVRYQVANNLDSAFYYCNKIEESNHSLHQIYAKSYKSYLFQLKGDTIKSNTFMDEANQILRKEKVTFKSKEICSHVYHLEGLIAKKRGKFYEALDKFEKGKLLSNENKDLIQIFKLNNNISSIYAEIGNYNVAINKLKENDSLLDRIGVLFSNKEFEMNKSIVNYNIANIYENLYSKNNHFKDLDTAINYLNKTIRYSDNLLQYKIRAIIDLGSINKIKGNHIDAEKYYNSADIFATDNHFIYESIVVKYNLGDLFFTRKNYEKALIYFKQVDSISIKYNLKKEEYILSNYFQAKIYQVLNENDKAVLYSNIYLNEFEKGKDKLFLESVAINSKINNNEIKLEVENIKKAAERSKVKNILFQILLGVLFSILIFYLIKMSIDKKRANLKVEKLLNEYKINKEEGKHQKKISQAFNIDDEKERDILEKLIVLEEKKYFLDPNFNQQNVAKKIKTNTTYLSNVVNKNFGKTFSEYSNELKINYAIEELINNPVYRKYSTQAIAESVGYKNANSFTISFKKRAGMTPAQFILNIQNRV